MGKINWGRVVLCGIVAGLAWTVVSSIITAFVERDFVAAVPRGRLSAPSGGLIAFLFIVNLVMGIWAIWLYAAIRPQSSPSCPRFPFRRQELLRHCFSPHRDERKLPATGCSLGTRELSSRTRPLRLGENECQAAQFVPGEQCQVI